jgi:Zn-dependent protease with chaperone function
LGIDTFPAAVRVLAGIALLTGILAAQESVNAAGVRSQFNIQAQTACETEMLREMGAREVFSGKSYEMLADVARAYGRAIPHFYTFSGSFNMFYIAASTAMDGRGKIVVGQQAIELFDAFSLKGFLGHEMAHLVSDSVAQGCNDYVLRDPQMEAEADALAARTLGTGPVKAFLNRAMPDGDWKRCNDFNKPKEQGHHSAVTVQPSARYRKPAHKVVGTTVKKVL